MKLYENAKKRIAEETRPRDLILSSFIKKTS